MGGPVGLFIILITSFMIVSNFSFCLVFSRLLTCLKCSNVKQSLCALMAQPFLLFTFYFSSSCPFASLRPCSSVVLRCVVVPSWFKNPFTFLSVVASLRPCSSVMLRCVVEPSWFKNPFAFPSVFAAMFFRHASLCRHVVEVQKPLCVS